MIDAGVIDLDHQRPSGIADAANVARDRVSHIRGLLLRDAHFLQRNVENVSSRLSDSAYAAHCQCFEILSDAVLLKDARYKRGAHDVGDDTETVSCVLQTF